MSVNWRPSPKALDLQNIGLTCVGGMEILNLLQDNKSLSILDVHNNPGLDTDIFESIMNVLATNNVGKKPEVQCQKLLEMHGSLLIKLSFVN
jgi:hypothetical protein